MIAFLGMGLLGSNFVRALCERGEPVRVWNRSAAKAAVLAEVGAEVATSPEACVRGADRVHLVLSDDASVDEVLGLAAPGLGAGAIVLDHTTTSTEGAKARAARFDGAGKATYVHAPVFMGPSNARKATGLMLLSGAEARVARARPLLAPMTGKLVELGDDPSAAAAHKLLGNMFLMFVTSGLADTLGLAKAMGLRPEALKELFTHFDPGAGVPVRLARMLEGSFDKASWELTMARKDARLMLEEAARGDVPLRVLPAIAAQMDHAIAQGDGAKDWTVVAREALR